MSYFKKCGFETNKQTIQGKAMTIFPGFICCYRHKLANDCLIKNIWNDVLRFAKQAWRGMEKVKCLPSKSKIRSAKDLSGIET